MIARRAQRRRGAAAIGFWFGFGHQVAGLYWMTEAILIEADRISGGWSRSRCRSRPPCWRCSPRLPARWPGAERSGGRGCLLVLAAGWVLSDLAKQFVATGFPWNAWGTVWAVPGGFGDVFLQPAALVGVHGLTLATVLLAGLPTLGRRGLAAGGVALLVWAGFGVLRPDRTAGRARRPGSTSCWSRATWPWARRWTSPSP